MKQLPQTAEGLGSLFPCECMDPGCPVHRGSETCKNTATSIAYRIDMEDETGTPMCEACADDANESGVFRVES